MNAKEYTRRFIHRMVVLALYFAMFHFVFLVLKYL